MHKARPMTETEQAHRLFENLMTHVAKGREWATPGAQAALQRAVAGLDTGIETASPRLQELLRGLADELAGGVETLTPRVQERLKRVAPQATVVMVDPGPAGTGRSAFRNVWWIAGLLAVAIGGLGAWRSFRKPVVEPMPTAAAQESVAPEVDADPDLAAGRI